MLIARRFCSARLFRAGQYQRGEFSSLSRGCVATVTTKTIVPGKVAARGEGGVVDRRRRRRRRNSTATRGCGKIDRMETATGLVQTDRSWINTSRGKDLPSFTFDHFSFLHVNFVPPVVRPGSLQQWKKRNVMTFNKIIYPQLNFELNNKGKKKKTVSFLKIFLARRSHISGSWIRVLKFLDDRRRS